MQNSGNRTQSMNIGDSRATVKSPRGDSCGATGKRSTQAAKHISIVTFS